MDRAPSEAKIQRHHQRPFSARSILLHVSELHLWEWLFEHSWIEGVVVVATDEGQQEDEPMLHQRFLQLCEGSHDLLGDQIPSQQAC
jgi:hypothetical protein